MLCICAVGVGTAACMCSGSSAASCGCSSVRYVQLLLLLRLDILDSVRSVEDALDHMTHTELIHSELLVVCACPCIYAKVLNE
jgi:hypothetical protein